MAIWEIPITIVEFGRLVVVEADSKAEALRRVRARKWDECFDATAFRITVSGKAREITKEHWLGGK